MMRLATRIKPPEPLRHGGNPLAPSNIRTTPGLRAGIVRARLWRIVVLTTVASLWLGACTSAPRYRSGPAGSEVTVEDRSVTVHGTDVVKRAESYLGTPYRMGGTSDKGMDCSGLVYNVFGQIGIALPRTSSDQASFGTVVSRDALGRGDLVFFRTGKGSRITHVGIYAGNGEFIHASTQWKRVRFDRLDNKYFRTRYVTARRVL